MNGVKHKNFSKLSYHSTESDGSTVFKWVNLASVEHRDGFEYRSGHRSLSSLISCYPLH
jgi:hypothetical protein